MSFFVFLSKKYCSFKITEYNQWIKLKTTENIQSEKLFQAAATWTVSVSVLVPVEEQSLSGQIPRTVWMFVFELQVSVVTWASDQLVFSFWEELFVSLKSFFFSKKIASFLCLSQKKQKQLCARFRMLTTIRPLETRLVCQTHVSPPLLVKHQKHLKYFSVMATGLIYRPVESCFCEDQTTNSFLLQHLDCGRLRFLFFFFCHNLL